MWQRRRVPTPNSNSRSSNDATRNALITTGGNVEQNAGKLTVGGALGMSIGGNWNLGVQETGETKVVARANGISPIRIS